MSVDDAHLETTIAPNKSGQAGKAGQNSAVEDGAEDDEDEAETEAQSAKNSSFLFFARFVPLFEHRYKNI